MFGGMGGAGSAGAAGGAIGGGSPWSMLAQLVMGTLQNNAQRNQQARQTATNAALMRYSPWTGLANTAAQGQQANLAWSPGADLGKKTSDVFGGAMAQQKADQKASLDQAERDRQFELENRWLDIMSRRGK